MMWSNGLSQVGLWGMMGGMSTIAFLTWLIVFIDLVLLAVWLWKQIDKIK
ncbi:MAG: hypothetical protein Q8R36_00205 [bacterium]|nr:hypothetical protein [bacterium]